MLTHESAEQLELLYHRDETGWLEAMSALAAEGRLAEMDLLHLSEYLLDMSKRDRREVVSRLIVLLTHLLKWELQPARRTGSWKGTIREQRRELRQLFESGTLRLHGETTYPDAYAAAREQAADEMDLEVDALPVDAPWSFTEALGEPGI